MTKNDLTMEEILKRIKDTMEERDNKNQKKDEFSEGETALPDNKSVKIDAEEKLETDEILTPKEEIEPKIKNKTKTITETEEADAPKHSLVFPKAIEEDETDGTEANTKDKQELKSGLESDEEESLSQSQQIREEEEEEVEEEENSKSDNNKILSHKFHLNHKKKRKNLNNYNDKETKEKSNTNNPNQAGSLNQADFKRQQHIKDKYLNKEKFSEILKASKEGETKEKEVEKTDNQIKEINSPSPLALSAFQKDSSNNKTNADDVYELKPYMILRVGEPKLAKKFNSLYFRMNELSYDMSKQLSKDLTITYLQPKIEAWFRVNLEDYLKKYLKD